MKEVIVLMQEQNTTVRKKGQHLTSFERGRIATLHSQGYSNRAIARALNVCHQTINNELCRGEIDQVKKVNDQRQYYAVYSPETAQAKYEANRAQCHRPLKLVGVADFIDYFTTHLRQDGWSPDAAVGRAKLEGLYQPEEMVSTKTLYHYIDAQLLEVRNLDATKKRATVSNIITRSSTSVWPDGVLMNGLKVSTSAKSSAISNWTPWWASATVKRV